MATTPTLTDSVTAPSPSKRRHIVPRGKASDLSCSEFSSESEDEYEQLSAAGFSSWLTPQKIEEEEANKSQSNSEYKPDAAGNYVAVSSSVVNDAAVHEVAASSSATNNDAASSSAVNAATGPRGHGHHDNGTCVVCFKPPGCLTCWGNPPPAGHLLASISKAKKAVKEISLLRSLRQASFQEEEIVKRFGFSSLGMCKPILSALHRQVPGDKSLTKTGLVAVVKMIANYENTLVSAPSVALISEKKNSDPTLPYYVRPRMYLANALSKLGFSSSLPKGLLGEAAREELASRLNAPRKLEKKRKYNKVEDSVDDAPAPAQSKTKKKRQKKMGAAPPKPVLPEHEVIVLAAGESFEAGYNRRRDAAAAAETTTKKKTKKKKKQPKIEQLMGKVTGGHNRNGALTSFVGKAIKLNENLRDAGYACSVVFSKVDPSTQIMQGDPHVIHSDSMTAKQAGKHILHGAQKLLKGNAVVLTQNHHVIAERDKNEKKKVRKRPPKSAPARASSSTTLPNAVASAGGQ